MGSEWVEMDAQQVRQMLRDGANEVESLMRDYDKQAAQQWEDWLGPPTGEEVLLRAVASGIHTLLCYLEATTAKAAGWGTKP